MLCSGVKHDIIFLKDKSIQLEFLPEFLAKTSVRGISLRWTW